MKKYLLPKDGNFYKANMHCHTHLSDATWTPEEVKEEYKKRGYSIVAFTDHDILIPHPELADENFLPLNGCEIEVNENDDVEWREMKTCHMCCIALEPDNFYQVCYNRSKYLYANAINQRNKLIVDELKPDFERVYSGEGICAMMKEARDSGFFVTYNHPTSSMEYYPDYMSYENMHALEICNGAGVYGGHLDYCPNIYDDMLRGGKRIFCVAGDDGHRSEHAFGAFTMIKAPKLEYKAVTDSLMAGNFYASQGPLIDELWIEDGIMHIKCPGAEKIVFHPGLRRENKVFRAEGGKPVTEGEYEVKPDHGYVRVTVYDKYGRAATTNAYFTDELLS